MLVQARKLQTIEARSVAGPSFDLDNASRLSCIQLSSWFDSFGASYTAKSSCRMLPCVNSSSASLGTASLLRGNHFGSEAMQRASNSPCQWGLSRNPTRKPQKPTKFSAPCCDICAARERFARGLPGLD